MSPPDAGDRPIAVSKPIGDEVKTTTCYMCACRCGIKVHLKDGSVRYIEGNRDHPSIAACSAPRARPGSCSTTRRRV